ncbi:unnamed protein product [Ilex paraguariensis]|uniref:MMS19 nucleotide excision repair protein n=1 Tax=Ilex paraguariensis TaxID=185542 RepID=A0ABC8S8G6_9AQUA
MAASAEYVKHIESYVDSSSSATQQAASVDAIAALLKNDMLTVEALVKEMEMYLTTTDSIIRARGILLLGELLTKLASKLLDNATIHSLIGFFTERLADWRALRGALVGCLALMRRKSNVGSVTDSEARAVAQSLLENLQAQSLGQHDRKLCFELVECLLDDYPDAVVAMGDYLVYGVCESIDGEKDPQCLRLTFHIVEDLALLFPDPSGPLASFAEGLFEILGCYFPIHFTHPKGEDVDVKREELSRALMLAFAATPLFEPFAIPLLLEKLSSSLPSAKVESLKYLSYCAVKYGSDRMAKHVEALWSSLKDATLISAQASLPLESESLDGMGFQENEIVTEALRLLEKLIQQSNGLFLSFVLGDEDIKSAIITITSFNGYDDIPLQSKQRLHAIGCILSVSSKASIGSCNSVFESFFPHLMEALGLSVQNSSWNGHPDEPHVFTANLNFGSLYLSVEILAACRYLVVGSDELNSLPVSSHETWCSMLHSFCSSLTEVFCSTFLTSMNARTQKAYIQCGVKGLQILATFPESFSPVPKSIFENILLQLMSIILSDFNRTLLWKLALKSLGEIGSFINKYHESEKALIFEVTVIEKTASMISCEDSMMPFSLKMEVATCIGMTGLPFMLRIVEVMDKAISANLSEVYAHGNLKSAEFTIQLLECYCNKLFPWFDNAGGFEEVPLHFTVNLWNQIENSNSCSSGFQDKKLLGAIMAAMKYAVGCCMEESQTIIVQKAFRVLTSSSCFQLESLLGVTGDLLEGLRLTHDLDCVSCRDEWIISLFASVVIALCPETDIPHAKVILQLFLTTLLKGHVPSAHALGSLVNKLPLKINGTDISKDCSLEESMDLIFNSSLWGSCDNGSLRSCLGDGSEMDLSRLRLSSVNTRVHAIIGLAWMGKGLLMRGHEKVKDIIMTFLSCIMSHGNILTFPWKHDPLENSKEQEVLPLMKYAADAFQILMSDSEACLNRGFHATIRPLYKQRFFNTMMPILLSAIVRSNSSISRRKGFCYAFLFGALHTEA